nr:MAG TPA: hypothetical protein [Caudoviricetes sp.]
MLFLSIEFALRFPGGIFYTQTTHFRGSPVAPQGVTCCTPGGHLLHPRGSPVAPITNNLTNNWN